MRNRDRELRPPTASMSVTAVGERGDIDGSALKTQTTDPSLADNVGESGCWESALYLRADVSKRSYLYQYIAATIMPTMRTNPPSDTPMITGIKIDEDDVRMDAEVGVGLVVGALVGGNTSTSAEVLPREVAFTLAVTVAPSATDAAFNVRVKFPDENAAAI